MEKIRFGKTGLMVSRVGFGGIPIQRLSMAESVDVVRGVIDLGINFIDTANAYSNSEEKIGEAIKGIKRESLVIASKSTAIDKKTFLNHLDLCPKGIGISYVLTVESFIKRMPLEQAIKVTNNSIEKARTCIECGVCMERCPYKLQIPRLLKDKVTLWEKVISENVNKI
ncbi:MAG: aldo/keto reductase [Planctomycetaceae bacterium]|jgi:predicted aldo/keto reductase-like oxidoreductase|nr:aldo/keto reductase [Planctomycetaceae bacterium]